MENVGATNGGDQDPPTVRVVTVDPRKFSEYVLVPGHKRGKDRVFLGMLGFRPRNEEDAQTLTTTYLAQARERLAEGRFKIGQRNRYGQRYTIEIEVRGFRLLSGWLLRPDGTLTLSTPFAGFGRQE